MLRYVEARSTSDEFLDELLRDEWDEAESYVASGAPLNEEVLSGLRDYLATRTRLGNEPRIVPPANEFVGVSWGPQIIYAFGTGLGASTSERISGRKTAMRSCFP